MIATFSLLQSATVMQNSRMIVFCRSMSSSRNGVSISDFIRRDQTAHLGIRNSAHYALVTRQNFLIDHAVMRAVPSPDEDGVKRVGRFSV
jgi:hypothetical protein